MSHRFTHLHVASGYSLRYGASSPLQLVEQACAEGLTSLALTDRDGLYGAIKFVKACNGAGISPALGVDLAVEPILPGGRRRPPGSGVPEPARRAPVRGGASVDPRLPRVTALALASGPGTGLQPGQGWGHLCRLVTATHLRGERGRPVATIDLIAEHAMIRESFGEETPRSLGEPALIVLLGPDSEYGRAVLAGRADLARAVLERWQAVLPPAGLAVEIVCHRGPQGAPASLGHAARMLNLARQIGVPTVLSNAVRHATRDGAVTVDVLDAARRLVAIGSRHLDRTTSEGYLTGEAEMACRAHEIAEAAGDPALAGQLLAMTEALAERCLLPQPFQELDLNSAHLPEPEVLDLVGKDPDAELERRCREQIPARYPRPGRDEALKIEERLHEELDLVQFFGIPTYFLTIANVCDLIRGMGVRVAARGSGAGSLINYLLGISGVDPLRHDLLMERFITRLRSQLPDVDLDVESDRRTEVYERLLEVFGGDRVSCVSMMDTYRARHAIRDVGAVLGMPPGEIDTIAKSFPHIRARDVRSAISELPELRASGLGHPRLGLFFDLVERLDGLPRHIALHPCGVLISDNGLLDRTPVEASWMGFPMSQFDKDDVEFLGLLKLDILGIRMQSAMSYAITEIARVDGADTITAGRHDRGADYFDPNGTIILDAVPHDDPATFALIQSTRTLGCFQIESPGQRELVGKFAPESFHDLIIDISLFRPGPVKSDMITPFLRARQGWDEPEYLHPILKPVLEDTWGVVVFHEQVMQIVSVSTGCDLATADGFRRAMGVPAEAEKNEKWFRHHAARLRYSDGKPVFDQEAIERIWDVLKAFASFGFCKAHAAAFALPTYQSAWLKAHHPAAFLAGVLTHDPGMYPKRLILDDARNFGISVLPLDVNHSDSTYRVEKIVDECAPESAPVKSGGGSRQDETGPGEKDVSGTDSALQAESVGQQEESIVWGQEGRPVAQEESRVAFLPSETELEASLSSPRNLPDGSPYGIRIALAEVKGISEAEVERIVANRPYRSLADFWHRTRISRPIAERLIVTGAFDSIYALGDALAVQPRGHTTRRDLLLQLADLERWSKALDNSIPRKKRTLRKELLGGIHNRAGLNDASLNGVALNRTGLNSTRLNHRDPMSRSLGAVGGPGRRGPEIEVQDRRDQSGWVSVGENQEDQDQDGRDRGGRDRDGRGQEDRGRSDWGQGNRELGNWELGNWEQSGGGQGRDQSGWGRDNVARGGRDRDELTQDDRERSSRAPSSRGNHDRDARDARDAQDTESSRNRGSTGSNRDSSNRDSSGVRYAAALQSRSAAPVLPADEQSVQLSLDLGDSPDQIIPSGLPEMTNAERTRAELEVLGLDASRHVLEFYEPMLEALAVTRARDVRTRRSRAEILIAGVKVATQTPPIRTGRRVVFLTLDDSTGPVDATFFEDVQGPYASTVFHSWLLVVRGVLRKTGRRGVSLRATGAWELPVLWEVWMESGLDGVLEILHADEPTERQARRPLPSRLPATAFHAGMVPADAGGPTPGRVLGISRDDGALPGAEPRDWEAQTGLPSGDREGTGVRIPGAPNRSAGKRQTSDAPSPAAAGNGGTEEIRSRRVLVHPSGFRQSPYADLRPPGGDTKQTRQMLAAEHERRRESPPGRGTQSGHETQLGNESQPSREDQSGHGSQPGPGDHPDQPNQESLQKQHRQEAARRRREPPRKLWHSSPGSSGR
ncbi:DNA polymerase III subunit alpha [Kineosporia babensis]|uniref:DNA polymerase III subunit alpha n=1 Tax=Kineosporia babensis TaxID=499548 RepID=A0A9X1NCZ8_9ACTN|nr:PHP domain-containing protein [Kineosporia babensis]MCD5311494.1 PHP domain-containing protein [Kineosporia babensis]